MAKKNSKAKNPEATESESVEEKKELTEAIPSAPASQEEATSSKDAGTPEVGEVSSEDLLEDVRRSLIEEEADKGQKESKWWQRIGRKGKNTEAEKPPVTMEIDLPTLSTPIDSTEAPEQQEEFEEQVDEMDELLDMLAAEAEETAVKTTKPSTVEARPEPEPEIDFEKLKEQAFRRPTPEEAEKVSDVRSVALEGGEEVFVEVQAPAVDPLEERLRAFENALRPYRRSVNITLAFLGIIMAALASLLIFNAYQRSRPQPVKEASNLPYPTSVSLPGGWNFPLGKGFLQEGKWEPQGAEWLEGTEVCRWVALPWSRQLEAVIRTLNPKDPIELFMSNNDRLVYQVYSVRQLSPAEMQKLDSNSPCLLLILTQSDSEKRWVLTALP